MNVRVIRSMGAYTATFWVCGAPRPGVSPYAGITSVLGHSEDRSRGVSLRSRRVVEGHPVIGRGWRKLAPLFHFANAIELRRTPLIEYINLSYK